MATQTDAVAFQKSVNSSSSTFSTKTLIRKSSVAGVSRTPAKSNQPKFKERKHLEKDSLEYDRTGDEPGLIIIFNHENFDNKIPVRTGSRRDVNEIILCFQRLGFNIDIENIFTDLTSEEVFKELKKVAAQDFSKYNSLILFYLTHGDEYNTLHTKKGVIHANEIWKEFRSSKNLENKPKMFVFQACKGENYSTTGALTSDNQSPRVPSSPIVTPQTFSSSYLYPDLLVLYSATEGNVSYRNPLTGTWFIQELCKNFSSHGQRDDVVSLIFRTIKCISGNYYTNDPENEDVITKQMPVFISTLRKKFFLNRNKDRDVLIRMVRCNEETLRIVKEIKKKLDTFLLNDDDDKKKKK